MHSQEEPVKSLEFLYRTVPGRICLKLLTLPVVSRIAGVFLDSPLSVCLIHPFIKANHLDLRDFRKMRFSSFNQFFTRELKEGTRTIDEKEESFISPCDGLLSVYEIKEDSRFHIKNSEYSLETLLHSRKLAKEYAGGYCMIFRLTVSHYHRYCWVDDGYILRTRRIPGVLHTVNPIAGEVVKIYHRNTREYALIETNHFGRLVQMEVGAMMVGRICNYQDEGEVYRGEEKGRFEFGGSTIIVLVKRDTLSLDKQLCGRTSRGEEIPVKMGQKIAKRKE